MRVLLLAGGYGGAKMAHGLDLLGDAVRLTVVGNTADDLDVHGLHVSPDLDTVMYTLAGVANPLTGWGVAGETWSASEMLGRYGAEIWFRLGDRDLATHIRRTELLRGGLRLTEVTARLCMALGVGARLLPMTDDAVRTKIRTPDGWLDFQEYFVRRGHRDEVLEILFAGVDTARPTDEARSAVDEAELIVIAPSNPFVSVAPILALPGLLDRLLGRRAPVVAVSPIVAGSALRGPAAQMARTLGAEPTAAGVARHYAKTYPGLVDVLIVDAADESDAEAIAGEGIEPLVLGTIMSSDEDRRRLAADIVSRATRPARGPSRHPA